MLKFIIFVSCNFLFVSFRKRGKCESARCTSSLYSCHVTTSTSKCKSIAMPDYVTELRGKVPSPVSFSPLKNFHPCRDEEAQPKKNQTPPPKPTKNPNNTKTRTAYPL